MGMNSQWARDKAINLMNKEGKELTVEFLMNQLAVEDCNTQHKFLSQLNSSSAMNFAAYDRRQNRGKSNRSKCTSGKNEARNKTRVQTSSPNSQPSRNPPGMEGKCMRCGKPEHQPGQKCAAKDAKCKDCHKIGPPHPPKVRLEEPILSGPHPTLDNRYLMIHHITDIWCAVCMCTNPQVRFVSWENR